jgi:membrane-bound ClpP family serine protease
MQRFTRTDITVSPGETPDTFGRVVSGFNDSTTGQISVRGEQWRATTPTPSRLAPGDPVRVVSRRGLTLTVEPDS